VRSRSTHGVGRYLRMTRGQTVRIFVDGGNENGTPSDCTEETNYMYGQFSAALYIADSRVTA